MSYFEYNISGNLTPELEEKTKMILDKVNDGSAFFIVQKYWDEDITPEKKQRNIVLTSHVDIWLPLFDMLKGNGLNFSVYYKQRII